MSRNNATSALMRCLVDAAAVMVVGLAGSDFVLAQHSDIAIYRNNELRITTHNSSSPSQPETRVFQRAFDFWGPPLNIFAGDDPGFQMSGTSPPTGHFALPADTTLHLAFVPLHIPGQAIGNLLFWDGTSQDIQLAPPPANHVLFVEDATGVTEIALTGTVERFDQLVAGVTDDSGGMHEHLTYALENDGATPQSGFYLTGWEFSMDGFDPSKYTLVTLADPAVPANVESQFETWLGDNLASIRIAGDFDDNNRYEVADVDALVAAIADGAHPVAFDLTLDGLVDLADLDLWRTLAGAVLNDSGGPVLIGDTDLDGTVDGQDFLNWNNAKFTNVAAWSAGDFNADAFVDGADFLLWNNHKFTSADSGQAVPEPTTICGAFVCCGWLWSRRGKRVD